MRHIIFTRLAPCIFNKYYALIFFIITTLFSSLSSAMEEEITHHDDYDEILDAYRNYNKKKALEQEKKQEKGLFSKLEDQKNNNELKSILYAFNNIDELFTKAVVKVSKLNQNNESIEEKITNLADFLGEPHELKKIIELLERGLGKKLSLQEAELLTKEKNPSFSGCVRKLWQQGSIADSQARAILLKYSIMTSQELIRLVENGVVKTAAGHLVSLRTGPTYGDALKLFDDISSVIKKIEESRGGSITRIDLSDLMTHPLPIEVSEAFSSYSLPPEETLSDAHVIREMRRHFLFVSRIGLPIRFRPGNVDFNASNPSGPVSVDNHTYTNLVVSPRSLSAVLIGNYYIKGLNASMTHSLFVNPIGLTYSGILNFNNTGLDWWLNYSEGFLGGGANYTVNFDQGTFWSSGQATYLSAGVMAAGWRNNLTAGISLSSVLANSIGIGGSATLSINRAHDVTYLGQYPMDGKFSKIRGLHKIEIDDSIGFAHQETVAFNFSATNVPLTIAFRAGKEHTRRRIYRTHADLSKTQKMLTESQIPGVLFLLGKKVKETRIPKFENPEILIDGDELVEIKSGRLSGAFVIGLESVVPISASRVGGSVEVTGEFELGLRRLPNDKFEVSIEPKQVYEMGLFASVLNIFGAGYIKSIAIARKQIFMFDFKQSEARKAYFDLIHHGLLPTSEEIEVYCEDRGPEYLLTEFRAQNEALLLRGIARTYLEKIRIVTKKKVVGFSASLVPAILALVNKIDQKARKSKERINLRFEGIDREFVRSHAKSVATNGLISVRRNTFGGRISKGQGFSGRYNQDIFVTHRTSHSIDGTDQDFVGNKWQFDSLIVHAQLEDSIITGNEENCMVEKINRLFRTFIGSFEYKNSKAPRVINIEREFSKRDLDDLTKPETRERVPVANQTTGIDQNCLYLLLQKLAHKHPDHQALIVKHFIESSEGFTGFAAIHQLLGARPEDLFLRTESGYGDAVLDAKRFIALYSDPEKSETPNLDIMPIDIRKNRKRAEHFYVDARHQLRELDKQLRLLYDDKYLLDDESTLVKIYGKSKVKELIDAGIRQDKTPYRSSLITARNTVLELLDLANQGFKPEDRRLIYKMAGKKYIRFTERVELFLFKHNNKPIDISMSKKYLKKRIERSWELIAKIDDKLKKIEHDTVMRLMDKEYLKKYISKLLNIRNRLAKVATIKHLNEQQKQIIKGKFTNKTHFPIKLFRKKKHKDFRIDGVLAQVYGEVDNSDEKIINLLFEQPEKSNDFIEKANEYSDHGLKKSKIKNSVLKSDIKIVNDMGYSMNNDTGLSSSKKHHGSKLGKLKRTISEKFHRHSHKKEQLNGLEISSEASF